LIDAFLAAGAVADAAHAFIPYVTTPDAKTVFSATGLG
jgi:hypothetical protein